MASPTGKVLVPSAIGTSQYPLVRFASRATDISTSNTALAAGNNYGHSLALPSQSVSGGVWVSGKLDASNNICIGLYLNGAAATTASARVWGLMEFTDGANTEYLGQWLGDITGTATANGTAVNASSALLTPAAGDTWRFVDSLVISSDKSMPSTPARTMMDSSGLCMAVWDFVGFEYVVVQTKIGTATSAAPVFKLLS